MWHAYLTYVPLSRERDTCQGSTFIPLKLPFIFCEKVAIHNCDFRKHFCFQIVFLKKEQNKTPHPSTVTDAGICNCTIVYIPWILQIFIIVFVVINNQEVILKLMTLLSCWKAIVDILMPIKQILFYSCISCTCPIESELQYAICSVLFIFYINSSSYLFEL